MVLLDYRDSLCCPTLCVSGGRIGLQVELSPEDLGRIVPLIPADIAAEEEEE